MDNCTVHNVSGDEIIFKTFSTYKHHYIYDRHTDAIIRLPVNEYNEMQLIEKGELQTKESAVFFKLAKLGLLEPNIIEKIEHPSSMIIEQHLKTRIKQLILQVTQECNLRCKYCVYSGEYKGFRKHSNHRMSFETAKKAIDFFIKCSSEITDGVISFYGGEPLLEFDLIKKCVEYTKSRIEGKRIAFYITTNGTLLTDEIADYLVFNNFSSSISIDGSKEEHDKNRVFMNGKGSFDAIMDNIKRIKARYPDYMKMINIMTTVNPHVDLSCVLEYFSSEEILDDKRVIFNTLSEIGYRETLNYDEQYYIIRNYEYIKMLFSLIDKIDNKYVSTLVIQSRGNISANRKAISKHMEMLPVMHHAGPCKAGVQRLFVRIDGSLFPCERVNEQLEYFKIGTLKDGFDLSKILNIINIGNLSQNECKRCWLLRRCSLCAGQMEFDSEPNRNDKLSICPQMENTILQNLYELCVLDEFGFRSDEIIKI